MSSVGISGGGDGGSTGGDGQPTVISSPQYYFCYQCNRTVSITPPSQSSELLCPNCNGGFLEEVENPSPNLFSPSPFSPFLSDNSNISPFSTAAIGGAGFPLFFSSSTSSASDPIDLSSLFAGPGRSAPFQDPDVFNPFQFLQNYLQNMRAGGANIQFVIENSPDQGAFRLPANLGDYFFGPGLEQLIQQLAENDPNRYGTPPAAKSAVEGLPSITVTQELLHTDSSQCAVCKDEFEVGAEAKQMPCKHVYHSDCILPWLELHNSCPVCRYELPTDDPDYEQRRGNGGVASGNQEAGGGDRSVDSGGTGGSGNAGDGGEALSQGSLPTDQATVERRFRITLPWPFRAGGSQAEGSNSASDGNNGNNDGPSFSGSGGNRNLGSETREEELD
ncbi:hypothetical protein Ancab_029820 [Ancistrocladus abbreviatus]